MIYLVFSVLISTLLFVIFKYFEKFNIDNLQAIVINYFVAFTVGYFSSSGGFEGKVLLMQPWITGAVILGFLFIALFNVMALTVQKGGLSVASVAGKMSVVIPVLFGVILYNESIGAVKLAAIAVALLAVYLTTRKESADLIDKKFIWLPIALFLGSGLLDTLLKYMETVFVAKQDLEIFSATIFLIAGCLGILFLMIRVLQNGFRLVAKNILAGILLGIPNYYSIYFLLKALQTEGMESSTIFTINNVSVVMLSTLFGILLFQEKLSLRNWVGIGLSITSILVFYISFF